MDSSGMPIVIVMLLALVSIAMLNWRATLLAVLATVGIGALALWAAPYLAQIPPGYFVVASLGCLFGAGGMIVFQKFA